MNVGWPAALAVAVALATAEVVRPTVIPAKMISHPRLGSTGQYAFTQEQLEDLPPIDRQALGNLDALDALRGGKARSLVSGDRLAENDLVELSGWCADPEARAPGAGLIAIVDGSRRIDVSAGYGSAREDVARLFGDRTMLQVGFDVRILAGRLGPGVHALRVAVVARDGRGIFIFPTVARVAVTP